MNARLGLLRAFVLAAVTAWPAAAQNTGASFLKIDTGARPAAMGGAYTAIADDVNALYYNPGGLPTVLKRELGATHTEWLLGSKFDFLGYVQPTSLGTFGIGLTRLTHGSVQSRAADRTASGSFDASDTAYGLGFGRSLGEFAPGGRTSIGGTVKYVESRIGSDAAATAAFDLGVIHKLDARPLSLGISVLNLGRGIRFLDQTDPLPLTFSVGGACRVSGALGIAFDLHHEPFDKRTDIGVGTEYSVLSSFSVRAGYSSLGPQAGAGSALRGLGGGFGIALGSYRADYTFTPFGNELGNAQRISVGARF